MGNTEPCTVHAGGTLPPVLFAPGEPGAADVYWRGLTDYLVAVGQALDVRGVPWLVEHVALWRGRPGGVHAKLRACNATGHLYRRTAQVTAYGVTYTEGAPVAVLGVLAVSGTTDTDGQIITTGDLTPVGTWTGQSGDLIVLDDDTRWEQLGDPVDRTASGGASGLPVIKLRRVRDGAQPQ